MVKYFVGLFALAMILVMVNSTVATIIAVGDPVEGESWAQRFQNQAPPGKQYDWMQFYMHPGPGPDLFEEPIAIKNFSYTTGWSQVLNDGTYVAASGTLDDYLQFDLVFYGSKSNPFRVSAQGYMDGQYVDGNDLVWNGSAWSYPADSWPERSPIPEPATLLLLGSGLIGMLGIARRKKRSGSG